MKRLIVYLFLLSGISTQATHIRFCVDMRNYQPVDVGGIHLYIEGDTNFYYMNQDPSDTMIYCVTLDLPADSCIQYDFLNGSDFYGLEFIPLESRVSDFNSDRWICTHSNSPDTIETGPLLFSGNAPNGLLALRTKVDMQYMQVDPSGVFVTGNFGPSLQMGNLEGSVYEAIAYVNAGVYDYTFANGSANETIPSACAVNGQREATVNIDTIVPAVCFASCTACLTGVSGINKGNTFTLFPNPTSGDCLLMTNDIRVKSWVMYSSEGKWINRTDVVAGESTRINTSDLAPGLYQIQLLDQNRIPLDQQRLVVQ